MKIIEAIKSRLSKAHLLNAILISVMCSGLLFSATTRFTDLEATGDLTVGDDTTFTDDVTIGGDQTTTGDGTVSGNFVVDDLFGRGDGTTMSTNTTRGEYHSFYLGGTVDAAIGSLMVATTPVVGEGATVIVAPATNDVTGWVGIAAAVTSTGSVVNVYTSGFALALTTQTVNAGDVLVSTQAAAGYLTADNTPTTGADVGVAVNVGTASGGTTLMRIR